VPTHAPRRRHLAAIACVLAAQAAAEEPPPAEPLALEVPAQRWCGRGGVDLRFLLRATGDEAVPIALPAASAEARRRSAHAGAPPWTGAWTMGVDPWGTVPGRGQGVGGTPPHPTGTPPLRLAAGATEAWTVRVGILPLREGTVSGSLRVDVPVAATGDAPPTLHRVEAPFRLAVAPAGGRCWSATPVVP
jgi:hypothetical protein